MEVEDYSVEILKEAGCFLCGARPVDKYCENCLQKWFCLSCDETYHRHPKRRHHSRMNALQYHQRTSLRENVQHSKKQKEEVMKCDLLEENHNRRTDKLSSNHPNIVTTEMEWSNDELSQRIKQASIVYSKESVYSWLRTISWTMIYYLSKSMQYIFKLFRSQRKTVKTFSSSWTCHYCTFQNDATFRVCQMCFKTNVTILPPTSASPISEANLGITREVEPVRIMEEPNFHEENSQRNDREGLRSTGSMSIDHAVNDRLFESAHAQIDQSKKKVPNSPLIDREIPDVENGQGKVGSSTRSYRNSDLDLYPRSQLPVVTTSHRPPMVRNEDEKQAFSTSGKLQSKYEDRKLVSPRYDDLTGNLTKSTPSMPSNDKKYLRIFQTRTNQRKSNELQSSGLSTDTHQKRTSSRECELLERCRTEIEADKWYAD